MANTSTGTVKWFNDAKGFGFITPSDGGADLFAHFKEIQGSGFRTLKEGQKVEFVAQKGPKGMQATQIRPLEAVFTCAKNRGLVPRFLFVRYDCVVNMQTAS